ncbi:TetR/AcrR family transcriptional regulator [Tissierella sp. MSJ-40]|uniref:TetR/AcrR family transcriptional regulator n=1 Tax=Tissierella simiarum TaxID=2841534 RepID=A0ABS6EAV7_9FIRM|nr:TetR/AcrR family transcriptional regulator [Tissierella simiarum]MBU5440069.1 TetR/AcrR family transcriptional regulator [Tissierella simiarum]
MPKIVDYEEKKKEIIKKAKLVFEKKGYYNTNLSHISNKCGMGRTTIYQYFKNKDEIFYHTLGSTLEEIKAEVEGIKANNDLTFIEKLQEIVHLLTKENGNNNTFILLVEIWLVLKREENETLEKLRSYSKDLKVVINDLIIEGINEKEIKQIDSESMAETIYNFIETFTLQRTSNLQEARRRLDSFNVLLDGLRV